MAPDLLLLRWHPCPLGILMHGGTRGLVLAAPVTEAEFLDPAYAQQFRKLRHRLRRAARLIGVRQISLAGILPGILRNDDTLTATDNREVVAAAVSQAVDDVIARRLKPAMTEEAAIAPHSFSWNGGGAFDADVCGSCAA